MHNNAPRQAGILGAQPATSGAPASSHAPASAAPGSAAPASPCTKVCRLDRATGYCLGCWRTGEEIGAWPGMSAEQQRALLRQLAARRWG